MANNENDFPQELVDAVKEHLERTRREATGIVGTMSSQPSKTVVISQFDEPVHTPVEDGLDNADPQSAVGVVDDYRDVASEAAKQSFKRQRKVRDEGRPVNVPQTDEPSPVSRLDERIAEPHIEEPLPDNVAARDHSVIQHEELYSADETDAEKKE